MLFEPYAKKKNPQKIAFNAINNNLYTNDNALISPLKWTSQDSILTGRLFLTGFEKANISNCSQFDSF